MRLRLIHEDKRGGIYLVEDLLEGNKEFTFMEIKKGFARGGCVHSNKEYFAVIKGKVKFIIGDKEKILEAGSSGFFLEGIPHAFIGLEDSIVSEWGITSEEKKLDKKDNKLRKIVDDINNSN